MLLDSFRSSNDKTEPLVLRVKHRPKPPLDPITVGDARSRARNTGAVFDTMSFEEHVIELCRTAFFSHHRETLVVHAHESLSIVPTKTLVHALVTSLLD